MYCVYMNFSISAYTTIPLTYDLHHRTKFNYRSKYNENPSSSWAVIVNSGLEFELVTFTFHRRRPPYEENLLGGWAINCVLNIKIFSFSDLDLQYVSSSAQRFGYDCVDKIFEI